MKFALHECEFFLASSHPYERLKAARDCKPPARLTADNTMHLLCNSWHHASCNTLFRKLGSIFITCCRNKQQSLDVAAEHILKSLH